MAEQWPRGYAAIQRYYGDIAVKDGRIITPRGWVSANIVTLPFHGVFGSVTIRCHRLVAHSLRVVLAEIEGCGALSALMSYGGCFVPRQKRGSSKLSIHAWGAAIDWNVAENAMGTIGHMSRKIVHVFESHEWEWGGRWRNPDPMHFQAAHGA